MNPRTSLRRYDLDWLRVLGMLLVVMMGAEATHIGLIARLNGSIFLDRWNRRRIMLLADSIEALATIALAVLFALGAVEVWHIFVLLGALAHFTAVTHLIMQQG